MEFQVLGPVAIVDDQHEVVPVSTMRRRLLAALLVHAGEPVSVDSLVDLLWPAGPPAGAVASLHAHVSRLRATLRSVSAGGVPALVTGPAGYQLRLDADQLDATRFERLVQRATADPGTPAASEGLDAGLALWRGSAYGEFADEPFARAEATRLSELRLGAVEQRAETGLALGRHTELVAPMLRFTAEHPLRERAHAALMLALYRSGRQADALAVFRELRRRLVTDLGLEPSAALQQLEADLLAQRREIDGQPPSSPVEPERRLPEPVTSLLGRDNDVAAVLDSLRSARLLTLTGVGGVGKTRLALAAAATSAGGYPDGTVLCELAAVADPEAVAPAVATTLGITQQAAATVEDSVVAGLRGRRLLLVLDNCEHVIDAAGRLAQRVAASCPQVTVLATSRQPLAIDGERRWGVDPLSAEVAARLFAERAAAVDPGFDGAAESDAIAEICRRLDGVPLAIELAAARVAALGASELARRLDHRFGLLTAGPRGTGRHRTLRAVVDWSYELLPDAERAVFDGLSVFAGSFTLDAAEAVCCGDGVAREDVAGLVAELTDRCLVVVDRSGSEPRYRLLETLRQYAGQRLAERGEATEVARRFVAYYLELAERAEPHLRGRQEAHWVAVLDRELDNSRAAHRHALEWPDPDAAVRLPVALHYYAHFRLRSEIASWAESALALPGAGRHRLHPELCGTAAEGAGNRGDLARARELADRGLGAAAGHPGAAQRSLETHAAVALYEGRLEDSVGYVHRWLAATEAAGEHFHSAFGYLHQALAHSYGGRGAAARPRVAAAERAAAAAGNPTQLAWSAYVRGETLADDDPDGAIAHLEDAIVRAEAVRNSFVAGVARVSLSALRSRHGSATTALRSFREVIEHWQQLGDWTHQWTTLRNLAELLARIGADEAAAVLHGAVTHPRTGAPAFGAGEHRLAAVAATLAQRLGAESFAAVARRGADLGEDEVVGHALTEIDRVLAAPAANSGARSRSRP